MRAIAPLALLLALSACSDYGLHGLGDEQPPPREDPTPEPTPEPVTCSDLDWGWDWQAGAPFDTPDDPVDEAGVAFWEPDYSGPTSSVWLPDTDSTPAGHDRFYRAEFALDEVPEQVSLDLQSDDGLWVWVNGASLGHWGGGWQQEGCVNEAAQCTETVQVDPVPFAHLLVEGENVVAARVSNPLMNTFFDATAVCD